jgi:sugar phosphate isomerase/epimerase
MKTSRRKFIKSASFGLALSSYPGMISGFAAETRSTENEGNEKLKLGLASYTFKEFSLDQAIAMTNRVGLKHIALKSFHLPLESTKEEIRAAAAKVRAGGLDLYGCSVVVLSNENEVHQAFEYAKTAGMGMIIAQPVAELLDLLEKKVNEYNIKLAIHNHGPEDHNFPSPIETVAKIKKMDPRIGLSIDVGHVRRSGIEPVYCIKKCADRLMDIHIKDLKTIQLVSDVCEVGRGKLDIPGILRSLIRIKFNGIVAFEYEKDLNDPLAGLAESVGYVRGVLSFF